MSIRHMISNDLNEYPTGAFCPISIFNEKVCVYDTHHGLCLFEVESNYHDDSDFYMVVWNEDTQSPEKILFATTRGWSYPCYASHVDATDEVLEKYNEWKRAQAFLAVQKERAERAKFLKAIRRQEQNAIQWYGIESGRLVRLRKAVGGFRTLSEKRDDDYTAILNLLVNKKVRNKFKLKMREQVIDWLSSDTPKYKKPLSPKQMMYV